MKVLELSNGWSQIPPKQDGDYWLTRSTSWHDETLQDPDYYLMIRVKGGKRVLEMDSFDREWKEPESAFGDPYSVWNHEDQNEMMAAWRPVLKGEGFDNPPPPPTGQILERFLVTPRDPSLVRYRTSLDPESELIVRL